MRLYLAAAIATLATATPAAAQFVGGGTPAPAGQPIWDHPIDSGPQPRIERGVGRDLDQANREIHNGRGNGQLSRRETRGLLRESRMIGALQARYARDSLSVSERAELATRVELLRADVNARRLGLR